MSYVVEIWAVVGIVFVAWFVLVSFFLDGGPIACCGAGGHS